MSQNIVSRKMLSTREMVIIAMFSAVMAVCSWISVPTTIPFTLQTFGVFCTMSILGGKKGFFPYWFIFCWVRSECQFFRDSVQEYPPSHPIQEAIYGDFFFLHWFTGSLKNSSVEKLLYRSFRLLSEWLYVIFAGHYGLCTSQKAHFCMV